jgi:molybdate transport system substrate-binding protein
MWQRAFVCACLLAAAPLGAEKIVVAAAADLKFALDEIAADFKKSRPADAVELVYGSSGRFYTQIRQGAPYDLYFSADSAYPRELVRAGLALAPVKPYAVGRLVLWSASLDAGRMELAELAQAHITRIAIANPKHAPYGRRAVEALRASGLWEQVQAKLIYGENVAQAAQFVQSGGVPVGIIALSLALSPALAARGSYRLIPAELHETLEQGFVLLRGSGSRALARRFAAYMDGPAARAVMKRYGFVLPDEALGAALTGSAPLGPEVPPRGRAGRKP